MNGLVQEVFVKVVVDMLVAESASRATSTHVSPIVVVVRNVKMSVVEIAECSVVAHERGLPVIVEVVPRNGHPVGGANNIDLSILVVLLALNLQKVTNSVLT